MQWPRITRPGAGRRHGLRRIQTTAVAEPADDYKYIKIDSEARFGSEPFAGVLAPDTPGSADWAGVKERAKYPNTDPNGRQKAR